MRQLLCSLVALALSLAGQARGEYVFLTFDVPGSTFTTVAGINNLGQIVGNSSAGSFLLSGGMYTPLNLRAAPNGINDLGQIVGGDFIYSGGNYTTLDVPGAIPGSTIASGINNLGQVVGSYKNRDFLIFGFLYSAGSYNGSLTGTRYDPAFGINNLGQIVGQIYDPNTGSGYLLTNDNYTTFGMFTTVARGINDSSQIVGYSYIYPDGMHHAFLFSSGDFSTFDVPGALSTDAYGINNAGEIVGTYVDVNGAQHGFLATPVPEPTTLLLLTIGALGIIGSDGRAVRQLHAWSVWASRLFDVFLGL